MKRKLKSPLGVIILFLIVIIALINHYEDKVRELSGPNLELQGLLYNLDEDNGLLADMVNDLRAENIELKNILAVTRDTLQDTRNQSKDWERAYKLKITAPAPHFDGVIDYGQPKTIQYEYSWEGTNNIWPSENSSYTGNFSFINKDNGDEEYFEE